MITQKYYFNLPPLSGEQAYLLAFSLEEVVKAIWKVHGDDMADFQGRAFPDEPSPCASAIDYDGPEESGPEIPF